MAKIITVDIEQFSYNNNIILQDLHFDVEKGECVVITGLSGCGKTSLLRLLNGLIPELYEGDLKGKITILGKTNSAYKQGELAKYMGNVFQNPNDQFFAKDVENEVALIGENMGMERHELRNSVDLALRAINIESLRYCKVKELSGGQKQKTAIASTLVFDSDIILLDEPSANLDYGATLELGNILMRLKRQGKTVIIAEHRLNYLNSILDHLIVIKNGKINGIFARDVLNIAVQQKNDLRCLSNQNIEVQNSQYADELLGVYNIAVENKGYKLDAPISFKLHRGECMALVGKNGIGKTTFARQLVGLLPIKHGSTSYAKSAKERLKNVSISLQNCSNMFFYDTVEKELIPKNKRQDTEYLALVKKYLLDLELWEKRTLNPHDLSGGEKQRLSLIIAMLKPSRLIILDEPTAGLDYRRMTLVANVIKEKINTTPIILITHDIELIFKVCNTAYLLENNCNKKLDVATHKDEIINYFNKMI